ncbi:uncharacterized protein LOC100502284 [Zea mays]|jgi:hypothetical protein|uniref:Uncharacterized protein n=1 Tax=Zea mays TaxID=4577 RepID=C4J9Y3_MAIZE|nr:uncharacterized protein LOC100502284 [Zea mays]ACR37983.1 unknown [Zea mays]|eukprot:NP_001183690.1 uncharacterized protein LOC100502284 [Zea mays]
MAHAHLLSHGAHEHLPTPSAICCSHPPSSPPVPNHGGRPPVPLRCSQRPDPLPVNLSAALFLAGGVTSGSSSLRLFPAESRPGACPAAARPWRPVEVAPTRAPGPNSLFSLRPSGSHGARSTEFPDAQLPLFHLPFTHLPLPSRVLSSLAPCARFFSLSSLLLCRAPAPDSALLLPTPISHGAQLGLPLLFVPLARS